MASDDNRDEHHEGPDAAQRFESTLKQIVSVPKAELEKREAAYKKSRLRRKAKSK